MWVLYLRCSWEIGAALTPTRLFLHQFLLPTLLLVEFVWSTNDTRIVLSVLIPLRPVSDGLVTLWRRQRIKGKGQNSRYNGSLVVGGRLTLDKTCSWYSCRALVFGGRHGKASPLRPLWIREKSAYTTDVYLGKIFRPNTPNFQRGELHGRVGGYVPAELFCE